MGGRSGRKQTQYLQNSGKIEKPRTGVRSYGKPGKSAEILNLNGKKNYNLLAIYLVESYNKFIVGAKWSKRP